MQGHIIRAAAGLSAIAVAAVSLVSLANAAPAANPTLEMSGAQLSASWTGPLSTSGRYIVDANGSRFKLKSANWDGAQGHWSGTGSAQDPANSNSGMSYDIPMGLDRVSLRR